MAANGIGPDSSSRNRRVAGNPEARRRENAVKNHPADKRSGLLGLNRSVVPGLPRLHQIVLPTPWPVGPVQIYLIEGDPVTLIDTGVRSEASRVALESALDLLGLALEDVQRIVLTHSHADHLGQAQTLRDLNPDVEVWAHEAETPFIEFFSNERDDGFEAANTLFREYGVPAELIERQIGVQAKRADSSLQHPALCEATRVERMLRDGERIRFKDF